MPRKKKPALGSASMALVRRLLRAIPLSVPKSADEALKAWVTWVSGPSRSAAVEARKLEHWTRRLAVAHAPRGSEATVRRRNLQGLAAGAGSLAALATAAKRTRFFYARVAEDKQEMGGRAARSLEEALGLEAGWMDVAGRSRQDCIAAGARAVSSRASGSPRQRTTRAKQPRKST